MKKRPANAAYDPVSIEKKWQKKWASSKVYKSMEADEKNKFYVLDMFPYPSGEGLHVGHPKGYIATDIVSRMKRMQGMKVLHPMGFDAFGLPAENYALKTKTNPADSVAKNVLRYKKQLELLGFDYDWSREVNTTDPKFYKWTQWAFLQMWKRGLAYESSEPINWCPSCKTGLANEDVEDGRCERCGTPVEKKPLRQWVLKITDYAERLLADLDAKYGDNPLLEWPEAIKESQRNWIGRSEGAEIDFRLKATNRKIRYVLIHGYKGSPDEDFFPWLKSELEKRGHEVEVPKLPNPTDPKESEQVDYVLKNCKFDRDTVVVGHSLGAVVVMKVLMKLGEPISGLVLAAAAFDPSSTAKERPYHSGFDWNFDYEQIKRLANNRIAVLSDTKESSRVPYLKALSVRLDAALTEVESNEKHFCGTEEPAVLNAVTPKVSVFTTRPDTIYGVTYMVMAPEHPRVSRLLESVENRAEVEAYIARAAQETEIERTDAKREKTGVELKGIKAVNPANGEEIPVWIADYVLADYGTGAVMAVPAHDERDWDFAKKFGLPIKQVISVKGSIAGESENSVGVVQQFEEEWNSHYANNGILINSGRFDGKESGSAMRDITTHSGGRWVTKYKLRDWVFSRQRYWGEPIPLIHCEKCGVVGVPEKDLPVKLPKVKSYEPTGTGESPLAAIDKWVNVKCPQCRGKAKRETNTMPQWAGSSWYYLRYMDPKNGKALVDIKKEKHWSPVDLYVGGAEHATRHLIYARFWHKFLHDIGTVSTIEPFRRLQSVGLIMGEDGRKMSKRFGNVVNPDEIVGTYGADTMRLYEMFMGPFDQQIAWSTSSMVGMRRFIERVWKLSGTISNTDLLYKSIVKSISEVSAPDTTGKNAISRTLHRTIKKVTDDIDNLRFNTAISTLMIALNEIEKSDAVSRGDFEAFLKLLAPFAPHVTEELWTALSNKKSIHIAAWPTYDPSMLVDSEWTIMLQVNGKIRGSFTVPAGTGTTDLEAAAKALPEAQKWLEGKEIKRVITIPGKLVNIVIA